MLTYVVAVSVRRWFRATISNVLRACALYIAVAKSTVIPMVWRACVSQTSVSVAFGAHLRPAPRSDAAREGGRWDGMKVGQDEAMKGGREDGRKGLKEI